MEDQKLKGKKVVVLGGTSGFGLATAKAAAAEGASVVVVSRSQSNVENALKELPAGTEGMSLDVTDEAAVQRFFDAMGGLDHLVYCAGDALPSAVATTARRGASLKCDSGECISPHELPFPTSEKADRSR